jgi:alanine racemase
VRPGAHTRWAEVDLAAIRANVRELRGRLPASCRLWAVVKANGYGHGAEAVARAAIEAGAWGLCVSTPEEAATLLGLCPRDRLLIMGGLDPAACAEAARLGCAVQCSAAWMADALEAAATVPLPVHLKIDTGMGRLGCRPEQAAALARRVVASERLRLAGVMTHFAAADTDPHFTACQLRLFLDTVAGLGVPPGIRHAANSVAALNHPEAALDAVRVGIALYGAVGGLRPALTLRSVVTRVEDVAAGASVGYGRTWTAARPARVATVAIGYEDGVMRARSNRGEVVVSGRRRPLVGRVSMDSITVDVTGMEVEPGEVVTLIGEGIRAEEVAEWSGTIAYEVLTAIGSRVVRVVRE